MDVGEVVSQKTHPLSFFSKKMCSRLQASSIYVREMYAITKALKKWHQYLLGQQFKIFTKKKSLHTLLSRQFKCQDNRSGQQNYNGMVFKFYIDLL